MASNVPAGALFSPYLLWPLQQLTPPLVLIAQVRSE